MCEAQRLRAPTPELPALPVRQAGVRQEGDRTHPTRWGMGGGAETPSELQRLGDQASGAESERLSLD